VSSNGTDSYAMSPPIIPALLRVLDVIPRGPIPNPELLADLMDREAFRIQRRNPRLKLLGKRRTGDALSLGFGPRHPGFHPLTDQGTLKLGERGHDREHQLALWGHGVNVFLIRDNVHAPAVEFVQRLHQRLGRPGQPIVPPDQHHIEVALPRDG
jgi:hypothetical protein